MADKKIAKKFEKPLAILKSYAILRYSQSRLCADSKTEKIAKKFKKLLAILKNDAIL